MIKTAAEYKREAIISIRRNWILVSIATAISALSLSVPLVSSQIDDSISDESSGFIVVLYQQLINLKNKKKFDYIKLFKSFKFSITILLTILLLSFYNFLWYCAFVIPGLIKRYSYSMTCFIVRDYPELKYNAAINKSRQMMKGYKYKLFCIDLTFTGWLLLSIVTFGAGFFWLIPYLHETHAAFYKDLKTEILNRDLKVLNH